MPRSFAIAGEVMVLVKGGAHFSGFPISTVTELGLAQGPIIFTPTFKYRGMNVDDYGGEIPAAIQCMMSEVIVSMTLINYDQDVLNICMDEAMGGGGWAGTFGDPGKFTGQGVPLDGGRNMFMSGNHMISLNLRNDGPGFDPSTDQPLPTLMPNYRVRSTYLLDAVSLPLSVATTAVELKFRGIPYQKPLFRASGGNIASGSVLIDGVRWSMKREVQSSGAVLWDYTLDTDLPDNDPAVEDR